LINPGSHSGEAAPPKSFGGHNWSGAFCVTGAGEGVTLHLARKNVKGLVISLNAFAGAVAVLEKPTTGHAKLLTLVMEYK